jgi:phenylpropionate dioxygenase-like ring-hydroxylating dioxygenase large terminal subunit
MFEGFAGVWTPVLASVELPAGRPLAVRVAGVPLVLFRDQEGRPAALLDRCPHRGAALSLGHVEAGRIVCPFHGWQLDGDGTTCRVPWNPDARRERLGGLSFPVRELGGQIWVYTGDQADTEPEVDEVFTREGVRVTGFTLPIETHWTRAMENMLDWPHLPFVHSRSIGRSMTDVAATARLDIALTDQPYGFSSSIAIDGVEQPGRLDFRFPNAMTLFLPIPGKTLVMQVACVPETDTRTRMVMVTARDFLMLGWLDWLFNRQNAKIAAEDRAVVESSFPAAVPPSREEQSVRTDAPTLEFRKQYFARLHGSSWSCEPRSQPEMTRRRNALNA